MDHSRGLKYPRSDPDRKYQDSVSAKLVCYHQMNQSVRVAADKLKNEAREYNPLLSYNFEPLSEPHGGER